MRETQAIILSKLPLSRRWQNCLHFPHYGNHNTMLARARIRGQNRLGVRFQTARGLAGVEVWRDQSVISRKEWFRGKHSGLLELTAALGSLDEEVMRKKWSPIVVYNNTELGSDCRGRVFVLGGGKSDGAGNGMDVMKEFCCWTKTRRGMDTRASGAPSPNGHACKAWRSCDTKVSIE